MSARQKDNYDFPVGSKFFLTGMIYTVRKAMFEMNTHMRQIWGDDGQSIVMLRSLQKEAAEDPEFLVL